MAGRPRLFDRDVALERAMREFWAHGFDAVTTAQLAKKMGINQPSLYAAFGNKENLFHEATLLYTRNLDESLQGDLAHSAIQDVSEALLRSAVNGFTRSGAPRGCLVMREPKLARRRQQTREVISQRYLAGVTLGEFTNEEDAKEMADYINGVLAGLAARALEGASRNELERVAAVALRVINDSGNALSRSER